ncbi:MAG: ABC transporter permease [Oscillospiraceae bacterium]|nr:ABC transporter permease [Oscillospiraceae bacterium]
MTDKNTSPLVKPAKSGLLSVLFDNKVIVLFIILCTACTLIADTSVSYIAAEVFTRFGRNTCLVLALIVPCLAGLGMNFGIVVGAIAAQIAIFWIVHWGFTGIEGFLLCVLMCTPLAIFFGWLLGKLYNNTKGAEMVAGLVLAFFADGVYRLFVLYIIGGVIPYDDPNLLPRGFGLRNAFDLTGNIKYALDDVSFLVTLRLLFIVTILGELINLIYQKKTKGKFDQRASLVKIIGAAVLLAVSFLIGNLPIVQSVVGGTRLRLTDALCIGAVVAVIYLVAKLLIDRRAGREVNVKKTVLLCALCVAVYAATYINAIYQITQAVQLPALTYAIIVLFCMFNNWILGTKLGQEMRTVGQSRAVAVSAGVNVDKTRIIATCISTVLAAWGQLIFLQNLGTFNTVQQQSNVGLYAVAAILVGGANVQKATNKQAVIGVILFHTLFVVAPLAATEIVGDSAISEYIRMFISYGVITVSLAMHAWKSVKSRHSSGKPGKSDPEVAVIEAEAN